MNISVVIPSYNRGEKLRETIESVEKNDFKGTFEILIINDKSTDNTREAITSLIEKFGNIRTLENPRNLGPAGSRNNGIKIAHGELIFFTDDDCVVPQNWLSFYFNFFKEHKEVYSAGGALEPKEKNLISFIESLKDRMLGIKQSQMKIGNEEVKTGFTNNCVYRKEVFASEGYFEENFKVPAGEDFEFNQRVARRYKVAFVPISVLHNHKYNWDYLFGILYKQGLGEMPPKNYKLIRLILKTPRLLWNIVRKLNGYRSAPTGGQNKEGLVELPDFVMRFLMLNWRDPKNPLSGGAERVSKAYLEELVRRGHEVFWFANDFPGAKSEETIAGIQYVRGGGKGTSVLKAIAWYRRQKPFDLVIDQHHGIPWYAPWWCKTHSIAYIHEVLGPIWNTFYSWPLSVFGRWQERWTHRLYRNIPFWVPSDSTKTSLLANGVREVAVFPNGTDTIPLTNLETKTLSTPLRLAVVCRLAPNKRVDQAIKVVRELLNRGVESYLTIVGTGEVELQLKQLVETLDLKKHVHFTGALSEAEKNKTLQQAHFLIHTSVREGWGLNVIEANAMGTPAIVYPVGGLVDSVVGGKTGIVVSDETPESIATALLEILRTPAVYGRYRAQAWERSKQLQWDQVVEPVCEWLEAKASTRRLSK